MRWGSPDACQDYLTRPLLASSKGFDALPLEEQEGVFGRTKDKSERLESVGREQPAPRPLSHVDLREGETADETAAKRNEITRRSTPYAFPAPPTGGDGVTGGDCWSLLPRRL